jgi:hypothetical protein
VEVDEMADQFGDVIVTLRFSCAAQPWRSEEDLAGQLQMWREHAIWAISRSGWWAEWWKDDTLDIEAHIELPNYYVAGGEPIKVTDPTTSLGSVGVFYTPLSEPVQSKSTYVSGPCIVTDSLSELWRQNAVMLLAKVLEEGNVEHAFLFPEWGEEA